MINKDSLPDGINPGNAMISILVLIIFSMIIIFVLLSFYGLQGLSSIFG